MGEAGAQLKERPQQPSAAGVWLSESVHLSFGEPQPSEASIIESAWSQPPGELSREKYAHSLRTIRKVGELAANSCLETAEGIAYSEMLRTDFDTAIGEMLNTDKEFRNKLDINPCNIYAIKNGNVVMKNSVPVVEMIQVGLEKSIEAAATDPRMQTQVERDRADLENAHAVEALKPGQLRIVLSMDPKEAMARDGEDFWANKLGYRKGLAFLQWYHRTDENTLTAGSYSVEMSDKKALQQLFAAQGVEILSDTPSEDWIKYAIEKQAAPSEAEEIVRDLRKEYYRLRGVTHEKYSVTDFLNGSQKSVLDQMFQEVYVPLAVAQYEGRKNQTMHAFAQALLHNSSHMSTAMRSELVKICDTNTFDDQASRVMEFMVRYGTVEELRKRLQILLDTDSNRPAGQILFTSPDYMTLDHQVMIVKLAANVATGAKAGRRYGGCAAGFDLSDRAQGESSEKNPQDKFGGNANDSSEAVGSAEDCYIQTDGCYCCGLNDDGTPRATRLTVTAYIDTEKTIHCRRSGCGAWLAEGGKDKFIGYIARRAKLVKKET